jgi:hypothetical protein
VRASNIILSVFREKYRNIFTPKRRTNRLDVYAYVVGISDAVMSIYRNLRENYEYCLRYDEAGEFFKKEMELKRNY